MLNKNILCIEILQYDLTPERLLLIQHGHAVELRLQILVRHVLVLRVSGVLVQPGDVLDEALQLVNRVPCDANQATLPSVQP